MQTRSFGRFLRVVLEAMLLPALLLLAAPSALARTAPVPPSEIARAELPQEGREVLASIRAGGPFRYERDGVVFGNREQLLPAKPRGYYREYTVRTPGARNRGARRIVCGGNQPVAPDVCFYTSDHYQSFQRIRE